MEIKIDILCPNCKKCETLKERLARAIKITQLQVTVKHVNDFQEFSKYAISVNVSQTPITVINGSVEFAGQLPFLEVLIKRLSDINSGKGYEI